MLNFLQNNLIEFAIGGLAGVGAIIFWQIIGFFNKTFKPIQKAIDWAGKWAFEKGRKTATFMQKIKNVDFRKAELKELAESGDKIWAQFVAGMQSVEKF